MEDNKKYKLGYNIMAGILIVSVIMPIFGELLRLAKIYNNNFFAGGGFLAVLVMLIGCTIEALRCKVLHRDFNPYIALIIFFPIYFMIIGFTIKYS